MPEEELLSAPSLKRGRRFDCSFVLLSDLSLSGFFRRSPFAVADRRHAVSPARFSSPLTVRGSPLTSHRPRPELGVAPPLHLKTSDRQRSLALALLSRYVLQRPAGDQGRSSGMKWPKADQIKAPEPIAATLLDRVRRLLRVRTTAPFDASPAVVILLALTGMLQFQHSFDPPVEAA